MFVLGNALMAVTQLIGMIAQIYVFILIGRVIVSWVGGDPMNPLVRFLLVVTDPFLDRIRRFVPPIAGLDFSILIALLLVQIVVQGFLVSTLADFARNLR
ncbi:MAG: YggT family protein [Gemmatimonadota bacterium]|nr:MAG: YggT family protein [Gemmatimonadota bacterium]